MLIGVNYTDLGYPEEKESGYYDAPWQWDKIRKNAGWIVQFASGDDHFIPIKEQEYIHEQLASEFHDIPGSGHFMSDKFPELVELVIEKSSISH